MARTFDYSKWDNIELSDDESDLHPNIDKASWFRMKHRSRLEREQREDVEKEELQKAIAEANARLSVIASRLGSIAAGTAGEDAEFEDVDALEHEQKELRSKVQQAENRIKAIDTRRSWNIDNICKVTEEKSVVNSVAAKSLKAEDYAPTGATERVADKATGGAATAKSTTTPVASASSRADVPPSPPPAAAVASVETPKPSATSPSPTAPMPTTVVPKKVVGPVEPTSSGDALRDRLAVMSYNDFAIENERILEHYSEIAGLEETKEYLFRNCDVLLHEHAQNYLLLSCLEDEMNKKHKRMKLVCRQSQIVSHIVELATSMRRDPREVVLPFFKRLDQAEHMEGFTSAVNDFIKRIQKRAVEKRREMDEEAAAERRATSRNGLDPLEVLESLPAPMRDAFESQDVARLQAVLASMEPAEAKKWMKLCVDSGLWVAKDESVFEDDA